MATLFHPLVQGWFNERFGSPTPAQAQGWGSIAAGKSTLIAAPTGSGKTLAAFLWAIDRLIKRALAGELDERTSVVYVSPLKALGNDIAKNLQAPLAEIYQLAGREGVLLPTIRVAVRSGDTPAHERQSMVRRPPHILITTPESLYILLTSSRSREFLRSAETLIVDEIHAVAQDKRGAHLALSLERLDQLCGRRLQRIGLSATQKPIEEIARLLVGSRHISKERKPDCVIVDVGHQREMDLRIEVPDGELGPIIRQDIWAAVYDKLVATIQSHRTTLIFVNTRRLVERVAHQLTERLGEDKVGAHHGSLSRKTRLAVEEKLKCGAYPVVVATASLELGIDIGHVDVVCHIGAPRNLAVLLQRVGRSGHWLGAIPKGIVYPLTRDDLVQSAAAIRALRQGELDLLHVVKQPRDILAQQMVATVASSDLTANIPVRQSRERRRFGTGELTAKSAKGAKRNGEEEISEEALWQLMRGAYPYENLAREEYEQVLEMLSEGVETRRSRRSAYIHRDRINGMLRPRRGARLTAITNGGAIPDTADYQVVEFAGETFVGTVHEDFAIESLAGDIFLLGNRSWRIRRVGSGKVWVDDAQGLPPSIPFWMGEAPVRTFELSRAVAELRTDVAERSADKEAAARWLMDEVTLPLAAAEQIVGYVADTVAVLGTVPSQNKIIAERFFDEAGGMQLILHSPWGGRVNRAWGLALRKRFCVSFDRELQAAATDDGICISLVEQHSFPLTDVFAMLKPAMVEDNLTQAALASPMFTNRWRWNATRALALTRFSGGKKVPVALQRMRAEDLLAAVFPEQVMCQDNRSGPVELPDHPLVKETIGDCLHEAMDLDGLIKILTAIDDGSIETIAIDTPAPSPMAHEILNANPYAFLDDAPLEERRARAVSLRRVDPWLGREFGQLDAAAIAEVCKQAWPEARNVDELHDLLLGVGLLPVALRPDWQALADQLIESHRATVASWTTSDGEFRVYVAAERSDLVRIAIPTISFTPAVELPLGFQEAVATAEVAVKKIVQGWLEVSGPISVERLSAQLGISAGQISAALLALESAGVVMRGQFTAHATRINGEEWCERVLLARIHRLTLGRLRKEIEPVAAADFMNFLLAWQRVAPGTQLRGRDGVLQVIEQLQGLELPAPAWERHIMPARIEQYDPADLEQLCLAGVVAWGRLRTESETSETAMQTVVRLKKTRRLSAPARNAPIAFLLREELDSFLEASTRRFEQIATLAPMALEVARYLERQGASFLTDIARATGLLKVKVEEALWQLVAHGLATGDGIAGLRVLLTPEHKRVERRRLRVISGGRATERVMPVGRWSLWRQQSGGAEIKIDAVIERRGRQLLDRYGIVFRELLARESNMPSWRGLLGVYRRLEARGEIRGGRFINGFVGEQFALPSALERLRALRKTPAALAPTILSAADPLNLLGIVLPGARLSPYSNQAIAYQNGVALEVGLVGELISRLQQAEPGRG